MSDGDSVHSFPLFFLLLSDHAAATAVAKRIIFCEPHPISNPSKRSDGVFLYMYSKLRRNRAWKGWRKSSSEVKGHDHCKSFCKYVISLNILGHLKKKELFLGHKAYRNWWIWRKSLLCLLAVLFEDLIELMNGCCLLFLLIYLHLTSCIAPSSLSPANSTASLNLLFTLPPGLLPASKPCIDVSLMFWPSPSGLYGSIPETSCTVPLILMQPCLS